MKSLPRPCPVCRGEEKRPLFRQRFGAFAEGSLLTGFDLVICARCGAGYADGIPGQPEFDRYYAEMSKYESADSAGDRAEMDLHRFERVAGLAAPHLHTGDRLLDIGCATGGLLSEFKRRGFTNLLGVDPSPTCARLTEQLHGIDAKPLTISTLDRLNERVDVAMLTGVLEHIRDVDASLDIVKSCLREDGLLYFIVPDATRYDRHPGAPFQFFSMEHVNYFSPVSLTNLLARHGFNVVFTERLVLPLSPTAVEPTVAALYRRNPAAGNEPERTFDDETGPALQRYIGQSSDVEERIHARVAALVEGGKPLAVWGVGTHTLRLLETSDLTRANLVAFIDSNVNYQGKELAGYPVVAPNAFRDATVEVLISSQTAEAEIYRLIKEKLGWQNIVYRLYSE